MQDNGIESLMQQGRWDEAVHACNCALQVQPTSAKIHAYLGLCRFRQNEFEEAVESFRRATRLDPSFVDAGLKLAQSLDRLQRYEEAFEEATEWLKLRPSDRNLQGLIYNLEFRVKGNRTDGWERTRQFAHNIVMAQDL